MVFCYMYTAWIVEYRSNAKKEIEVNKETYMYVLMVLRRRWKGMTRFEVTSVALRAICCSLLIVVTRWSIGKITFSVGRRERSRGNPTSNESGLNPIFGRRGSFSGKYEIT